ncbi:unnamed protein product [Pylaiella littoralis]
MMIKPVSVLPPARPARRISGPGSSTSLKRPRPVEKENPAQPQHSGDGTDSATAALETSTPSAPAPAPVHAMSPFTQQLKQQKRQQQQHQQQQQLNSHNGSGGRPRHIRSNVSLPWLADRFYLNVLASMREDGCRRKGQGGGSDWRVGQDSSSRNNNNSSNNNNNNNNNSNSRRGGGEDYPEAGGYANGPFFSLERLVEVVSDEGWPGIKAAIFGTFSLDIGRMAEEIPCLFSTSNQTIPVLVLHGDKTLHRRRRPRHTSREAATTTAPARPKETKQGGQEREEGGQTSDNYFLYRGGVKGKVSQERWDLAEAAGRLDRLSYWEQCMPAQVQVEKVKTGELGVHHPKFGLLFLNDGSLVLYVGTGNMGADTAIDATWVQRFGRRENAEGGDGARPPRATPSRKRDGGDDGDESRTMWKGDFADTLQGFLEKESWLMEKECRRHEMDGKDVRRKMKNTPEQFMLRELGIQRLRDNFDFSEASVDLVPSAPILSFSSSLCKRTSCRSPFSPAKFYSKQQQQQQQQQQQHNDRRQKAKKQRTSSPPRRAPSPAAVRSNVNSSGGGGITPFSSDYCWQGSCLPSCFPVRALSFPLSSHEKSGEVGAGADRRAPLPATEADQVGTSDNLDGGGDSRDSVGGDSRGGGGGGDAKEGDATARRGDTEEAVTAVEQAAAPLFRYGQLRMRYVLSKRRGQVGETGPEDLLILQPTSIGAGIDAGFIEVVAKNLMPDSLELQPRGPWTESRVNSVRIVWPSMQYIDACREDMSKSEFLRERQAATTMEVDQAYVVGQCDKRAEDDGNGFVFMSPDNFDFMGTDLHACLKTFQLHPATALAIPPRPAHIKSAMRLRKAPQIKAAPPPKQQQQQQQPQQSSTFTFERTDRFGRNRSGNENRPKQSAAKGSADAADADGWCSSGVDDGNGGVCEKAQHFAWFLLTSACLSRVIPLFPERAYHAATPTDCACTPCFRRARTRNHAPPPPPLPPLQLLRPRPIPLPVPFCLDSEAYADPDRGSPHPRFSPYMHTLKNHRPWSVEVQRLLTSKVKEMQFLK